MMLNYFFGTTLFLLMVSCGKIPSEIADSINTAVKPEVVPTASPTPTASSSPTVSNEKYLYIASGLTYAGNGVTMSVPVQVVAKYTLQGQFVCLVQDYNSYGLGDSPTAMLDFDSENLLVLIENTSGRRIALLKKDCSQNETNYLVNPSALSGTVRSMLRTNDGGLLVSKTTAIEKFNSSKTRVLSGASPFINAPAGACATSTTLIPKLLLGPNQEIIMLHAAASPNNQINVIKATGYAAASDCVSATEAPGVNYYPVTGLTLSTGKILIAYGSSVGVNQIYSYDFDASGLINPVRIYDNLFVAQGISSMTEIPGESAILISSAAAGLSTIEKFTFNSSVTELTRVGNVPFIAPSVFTRSISAMVIAR